MLANMMSELRKYGVGLILAHQYMNQLDPDIRHAVLGNAGSIISFRVGPEDATILADEFQPVFDVLDLLNLPKPVHLSEAHDRRHTLQAVQRQYRDGRIAT